MWTELPPGHDFDDAAWKGEFRQEMRRVVDLLHGNATIPARPGHAGGRYDADVSRWTLGYIIGREWEPYAVKDYDGPVPGARRALPRPVPRDQPAWRSHIDAWMAEQCDYLLGYEVEQLQHHPADRLHQLAHARSAAPSHRSPPAEEESAWRRKVGRPTPRDPIEYENDAIGLDAMLVPATPQNPAGWFASYHAYPYYPDFLLYDPGYDQAALAARAGRTTSAT